MRSVFVFLRGEFNLLESEAELDGSDLAGIKRAQDDFLDRLAKAVVERLRTDAAGTGEATLRKNANKSRENNQSNELRK